MKYLSLDIGTRRTGIAYLDDSVGIPLPLDTFHHETSEALIAHTLDLIRERKINRLLVGLPLLPSGEEGTQATFVRSVADAFLKAGIAVTFVDERYSTPRSGTLGGKIGQKFPASLDPDAAAACSLLEGNF